MLETNTQRNTDRGVETLSRGEIIALRVKSNKSKILQQDSEF